MAEPFDAYSQWFDIPGDRQPPNLYELLGLDAFESNAEGIETAFQKRYALVRQYQVGEHGDDAIRVLQELAKAHDCLSNKEEKERYDNKLLDESPELAPVLEVEAEPPKPKPAVPVEQRQIWVIMPAEGRRWGPLVKSQIEQAVNQGRIRSDFYFQQDDWLEPRPVTEFYRNLPSPPPARLAPVAPQQPPATFTVRQTPDPVLAEVQAGASYGSSGVAEPYPATRTAPARQPPWHFIIPCVGILVALAVLIPLLMIGLSGDRGQHDEVSASSPDGDSAENIGSTAASSRSPSSDSVGASPRSGMSRGTSTAVGQTAGATIPNSVGAATRRTASIQDWRTWIRDARFQEGSSYVAISPDGEMLASVANLGIKRWRLADASAAGQLVDRNIEQRTSSLSFSPDGLILAIGTKDGTIRLWHREPRSALKHQLSSDAITDIGFHSGGNALAYRDGNHSVAVVRVEDLLQRGDQIEPIVLFQPTSSDDSRVRLEGMAVSPSDNSLAIVGVNHISVWDEQGTKRLWEVRSDRTVYDACFSPDGTLLAVRNSDRFEVYAASTGKRLTVINSRRGPSTDAKELAFSTEGPVLAVRARGMIELWRVPRTEMLKKVVVPIGDEGFGLAFGLDGQVLAVGGSNLSVLRRGDDTELNATSKGMSSASVNTDEVSGSAGAANETPLTWQLDDRFQGDCYRVAISPDGKLLAASIRRGEVQLMQVTDGRVIHTLPSERQLGVSSVFSNDGTLLAVGSSNGRIDVWEIPNGKQVARITLPDEGSVYDLAFTPDSKKLICRQGFKPVSIVEVASGKQLTTFKPIAGTTFRSVALSPDGTSFAALASGALYLMRIADQEVLWRTQSRDMALASHVVFSPDGKVLAIRGRENLVVIRAQDGKVLQAVDSKHPTGQVAGGLAQFSRDGRLLLVASGRHAELWDWQSAERIGSFEATRKTQIRSIALGLNGKLVAASVPTDTMKVWRVVARTGTASPSTVPSSSDGNSGSRIAETDSGKAGDEVNPGAGTYKLPDVENAIDLLSLIHPAKDKVKGDWKIENGKLICSTQHFVPKIEIPYVPPEEYDFRVVFSQPKLRNPVNLLMPNDGNSFIWAVGGTKGTYYFSLEGKSTNPTQSWVNGLVKPNQLHTSVVQVRKDSVRGFVDGKLHVDFKTDFSDLKANSWHRIRDKRLLAVECDDPTTFHKIELIEITGTGKCTR